MQPPQSTKTSSFTQTPHITLLRTAAATSLPPSLSPVLFIATSLFSISIILSFQACHTNGTVQYVTLRLAALTQRTTFAVRQVLVWVSRLPFLVAEWYFMVRVYHSLTINPWRTRGISLVFGCYRWSCCEHLRTGFFISVCFHFSGINAEFSCCVIWVAHVWFRDRLSHSFPEWLDHLASPPTTCEWSRFLSSWPAFAVGTAVFILAFLIGLYLSLLFKNYLIYSLAKPKINPIKKKNNNNNSSLGIQEDW